MKSNPSMIILLLFVPAIFLLVSPALIRFRVPVFWKGIMLGTGIAFAIGAMVIATLSLGH